MGRGRGRGAERRDRDNDSRKWPFKVLSKVGVLVATLRGEGGAPRAYRKRDRERETAIATCMPAEVGLFTGSPQVRVLVAALRGEGGAPRRDKQKENKNKISRPF